VKYTNITSTVSVRVRATQGFFVTALNQRGKLNCSFCPWQPFRVISRHNLAKLENHYRQKTKQKSG